MNNRNSLPPESPPGPIHHTSIGNGPIHLGLNASGRVISLLTDGEAWLAPSQSTPGPDDDEYRGEVAGGWDECFPNLNPAPHYRDHGAIWGRAPDLLSIGLDSVSHRWSGPGYYLERDLVVAPNSITVAYRAETNAPATWAWHALFRSDVSVEMDLDMIDISYDTEARSGQHRWPQSPPDGGALKASAAAPEWVRFVLNGVGSLSLTWDRGFAPYVGIWLCNGGWPDTNGVHQLAVEPTNSPYDDLGQATKHGTVMPPSRRAEWWLRLDYSPSETQGATR